MSTSSTNAPPRGKIVIPPNFKQTTVPFYAHIPGLADVNGNSKSATSATGPHRPENKFNNEFLKEWLAAELRIAERAARNLKDEDDEAVVEEKPMTLESLYYDDVLHMPHSGWCVYRKGSTHPTCDLKWDGTRWKHVMLCGTSLTVDTTSPKYRIGAFDVLHRHECCADPNSKCFAACNDTSLSDGIRKRRRLTIYVPKLEEAVTTYVPDEQMRGRMLKWLAALS